jgi:NIMA (never in mitosis gene a)-related kinase
MKQLISQCLQTTPTRRPTVNQILKMPLIQDRIKCYLSVSQMQSEFSHTILHKQNVFDQPKAA